MIHDERSILCDDVTLATTAGANLVGDIIDTQVNPLLSTSPMFSDQLWLVVLLPVGLTGDTTATTGTIFAELCSGSANNGTVLTAGIVPHVRSRTLSYGDADAAPTAPLPAGTVLLVTRLPDDLDMGRYLQLRVTTATVNLIAGQKIEAFFTNTPARWRALADNVS